MFYSCDEIFTSHSYQRSTEKNWSASKSNVIPGSCRDQPATRGDGMCNFWATVFHHVPLISANSLTVIFCSTKKYTLPPRKVVWQGFIAHHSIIWSIDLHFNISGMAALLAVSPSLHALKTSMRQEGGWGRVGGKRMCEDSGDGGERRRAGD